LTTVASTLIAAKELVQAGKGIVTGFLVNVRVDLHRGGDVGVSQDHLGVPWRHTQLLQE
jgi:hypothetical protein